MIFKVGDQVRCRHGVPNSGAMNALGIITAVIPNDTGVDEFALYEVTFEFGTVTLYGAQIEEEPQSPRT